MGEKKSDCCQDSKPTCNCCCCCTCGCQDSKPVSRIPLIGEAAPSFVAETTQGPIQFPEQYKGRWVILFSHPADFTPVCTTEFMTFARLQGEFQNLGCDLVGLSVDGIFSHIAWLRTISEKIEWNGMKNMEVTFPLIADVGMNVASLYGMMQPSASSTHSVRAVFFIDPKGIVRTLMYYPASTGRNFDEILRVLIALQTADKHQVATPADWRPGDDVILPPPGSCGAAADRVNNAGKDYKSLDWFLNLKKL